jgi:hypothetical protein
MVNRGCDIANNQSSSSFLLTGAGLAAGATINLHKVRNLRGEQNHLERWAKDSDSLVREVSQTLYLQRTCHKLTFE